MTAETTDTIHSIILNIGLQEVEPVIGLQTCTVRLYRPELREDEADADDNAIYGEQALEATDLPLMPEDWKSADGSYMRCLCAALEIDPAWSGPVRLEVITDKGTFNSDAHLHEGLNSFFFAASKIVVPARDYGWLKKTLLWMAGIIAGVALIAGIWILVASLSGDVEQKASESVADTPAVDSAALTDSVAAPADTSKAAPAAEPFTPSPAAYYPGNYNEPEPDSDSSDADNVPAEKPKENYYGIEP